MIARLECFRWLIPRTTRMARVGFGAGLISMIRKRIPFLGVGEALQGTRSP